MNYSVVDGSCMTRLGGVEDRRDGVLKVKGFAGPLWSDRGGVDVRGGVLESGERFTTGSGGVLGWNDGSIGFTYGDGLVGIDDDGEPCFV